MLDTIRMDNIRIMLKEPWHYSLLEALISTNDVQIPYFSIKMEGVEIEFVLDDLEPDGGKWTEGFERILRGESC